MTVAQMEHAVDITLMLKHRLPNRFCTVHADCEYDARCLHVSWPQDLPMKDGCVYLTFTI